MKNKQVKSNNRLIILAVIAVALFGVLGFQVYANNNSQDSVLGRWTSQKKTVNTKKTVVIPAKKFILAARTTRSLDPKTGNGRQTVTKFLSKDPSIYLSIKVAKPAKGTKFEYVRYFNGKYIDHKSLATTVDKVDYVSFNWKLATANSKHLPGNYKVKLYTNGNFEKEVSYQVR